MIYSKEQLAELLLSMDRGSMTNKIAEEIASVQPMPSNIDWNALGRGYAAICSMHDREPLLKGNKASSVDMDDPVNE